MISSMGDATEFFSGDYHESRGRLLEQCRDRFEIESIPFNDRARPGASADCNVRDLAMDVVWAGEHSAKKLLILSSGLHGLEGRLGSACQLASLTQGKLHQLCAQHGWRLLVLHALNPFGFARDRRWDAEGVDANRNFLLPDEEYSGVHPVYQSLGHLLNPDWAPTWRDRWMFYYHALKAIRKHGLADVKQAIAEGQYEIPQGLFFGGDKPCWTHHALAENLGSWTKGFESVIHIDLHSGLGRWGKCQLLMDYTCRPWQQQWMTRFPKHSWETVDPKGIAYNARGGLGRWCDHQFADHNYLYLCAEVGTYPPTRVLRSLRLENQAWWHMERVPANITREAREMFCPQSSNWRNKAVGSVWETLCLAITADAN